MWMAKKKKDLLGLVMATGHFLEFHLAIKGHHLNPIGRRILYLRNLLAGVGIDDSAWIHSQRLDQLNLRLGSDNTNSQQKQCQFETTICQYNFS